MMKVLMGRSPRFQALSEVIRNVNEKLSPSSGLGIMEIWSSLLDSIPDVEMSNRSAELGVLASRLSVEHKGSSLSTCMCKVIDFVD